MKIDLKDVVENSFSIYAGMTIQNRAIIDARDGLKPSQRQCMYAQYLDKIVYKYPFKKSAKSIAAAMDKFYVHGDSSCYALIARMAKSFAMMYPLEEFDGSCGTVRKSNDESAYRYTDCRLSEIGCKMIEGIEKECIDKWFNNYDDTLQFPSVFPTLGYYNICNGSIGISTGLSASIPQFSVKEVNEAMIKLLWNPDIDFEEIYCCPDFCTGSTILNADEVKESMKKGTGKAIILRSSIEYDEKENALHIREVPYNVYTGTIVSQIAELVSEDKLHGIKKVDDLSKKTANIKIVLEKDVNVTRLVKQLYKETSAQDSYTINMVMLDKGTTPKVFGWKEALQAHLDHEIEVRTKAHKYDLKAIETRLNIITGILIAIANIDEVVNLIRSSKDKAEAKSNLMDRFGFNEPQVEAILKMTLSRLINLEIQSFKDEKDKLLAEQKYHTEVLADRKLLNKEIEKDLREVAEKYGDERKTRCMNLDFTEEEEPEPIEEKELLIHFTNFGNIYTQESTTLLLSRKGIKGSKVKLAENEAISDTLNVSNLDSILVFTTLGRAYNLYTCDLPINDKININRLFDFKSGEQVNAIMPYSNDDSEYFCFITEKGYLKKTKISEYNFRRNKGVNAIGLEKDDKVINVIPIKDERICILTDSGRSLIINSQCVNSVGRNARGIKGIKLEDNKVISAKKIDNDDKFLLTISKNGLIKKTSLDEFDVAGTNTKGKMISGTRKNDMIVNFLAFNADCDIIIIVNNKLLKFNTKEITEQSKKATGTKAIGLNDDNYVVNIIKSIS